jgi:hypothetical protein
MKKPFLGILVLFAAVGCHKSTQGGQPDGALAGDQDLGSSGDGGDDMPPVGSLATLSVSPQSAVLQTGTTQQFSATCTYVGGASDDCTMAGGVTWSSSRTTAMTVSATGLATWVSDPGANGLDLGFVLAKVGTLNDRASVAVQHPGDTFYIYMTPDARWYQKPPVVVGATVAIGAMIEINHDGSGNQPTGTPFQYGCNWKSSDPTIATVDRHGLATAVSPGLVTITCEQAGTAVYGNSAIAGWVAPGNAFSLTVVPGGTGNTTWYVRPDGGTPYVNATQTPNGQCDGKADAPYPGSGVNQHCAMGNLRYLWADGVTYQKLEWMIQGGDTVLVAPNPAGYNSGLDTPSPSFNPTNCNGNAYCSMPSIPSGTASRHTRILGTNYADCHDHSKKTRINVSYSAATAFSLNYSQFVDIACFEITDNAQCINNGNYTNSCYMTPLDYGRDGIDESAITSYVNYTDLFIHGLAQAAIYGPTGVGVVADYLHIRAAGPAGINMDDAPWLSGNVSVAGGFTLKNSITEFTGCVEAVPATANYPYIECRDQNTGSYGDGFGTGSTTGDWVFDHDIWRYNFQDGLDLLHSGMQSLTVTNSQSYGNDGQQYKIGAADTVVFQNNVTLHNCLRILDLFGDEPASALVPGVSGCRAAGDGIVVSMTDQGSYTFQHNTYVGYGATPFDMGCEWGWETCSHAKSVYQNNILVGVSNAQYGAGELPGLFYQESMSMPPNGGWAVRDHNLYFNSRYGCPAPLAAGEVCGDPLFTTEPAGLSITTEDQLDDLALTLAVGSPAISTGVAIPGLGTNIAGTARSDPPNIGAY